MAKRPEALSPGLSSIVSQQIEPSLTFSWNFVRETSADRQKSAIARVYAVGGSTPLITVNATTDENVYMGDQLYKISPEVVYEWTVEITNTKNEKALSLREKFKYGSVLTGQGGMEWPSGPDAYEYIGTRRYFDEIKANAKTLLREMGGSTSSAMKTADSLFLGEMVPTRTDFENIEVVLNYIAKQKFTYQEQVAELIEDGLGAQDIHKIYRFFDSLVRIGPVAASNINMSFAKTPALKIDRGTIIHSGDKDLTVAAYWVPTVLAAGTATLRFGTNHSEDLSYYSVQIYTGFSDYLVDRILYYRVQDVSNGGNFTFKMDHYGFAHASANKLTRYSIKAIGYNLQGSASPVSHLRYDMTDVALGVQKYQLRVRKMDLSGRNVVKTWYDIYNGPATAYVHNTGSSDAVYEYAVRLTDINGNLSPFHYFEDSAKIDPLDPPAAPKPSVKSITTNSFNITWPAVKGATSYELSPKWVSVPIKEVTYTNHPVTLLEEASSYTMRIRSKNKAGTSAWVSITGKTLARPIVEYIQKGPKCRTWRTDYRVLLQNGQILNKSGGYMPEKDNIEVMHGEWIELRDKYESGAYVKKGTRWGNHKSVFFLDYAGWKTRLAGKEIISVQIYIKRKDTQHGYPDDGRFLHVYSHDYANSGALPNSGTGPNLAYLHKAVNLDFDRGQGRWVTLPNAYGERLRDGKIKGIGFHHPASTRTPYSYIRFDARTFQLKIRYK